MFVWSSLFIFSTVTYLFLFLYVLMIDFKASLNRACAVTIFCMTIWSLELAVNRHPDISYDAARLWLNIGSVGWIGLGPSLLWFVHLFTNKAHRLKKVWFHVLTTIPMIIFFVAQLKWVLVSELVLRSYGYTHIWASSYWPSAFFIFYWVMYVWSLVLLIRFQKKTRRRSLKAPARVLFGSVLICLLLASSTDVVLPMFNMRIIPSMGPLITLIWASGLVYALLKYNFLTISPETAAENILATMNDMVILCDPLGKIVSVNRATFTILGYKQSELVGQSLPKLICEIDSKACRSFLISFGCEPIENIRLNFSDHAGRLVPVMISCSLLKNDLGDLVGSVTVAKDISDIEKAESYLRSSERKYRELVENINDVIFTINESGIINYISPRIQSLAGYLPEEITGKDLKTLIPEKEHPEMLNHLKNMLSGDMRSAKYSLITKEGGMAWISMSGRPIRDKEKTVGIMGVLADISLLVEAMNEINELTGLLPICSSCKKVRDDEGYWNQIESYIQQRSDMTFSHGICPDCTEKIYGKEKWYIELKKRQDKDLTNK